MATPTDRLSLARPEDGSDHWGAGYRDAMTSIDEAVAALQDSLTTDEAQPPVFIQPTTPDDPGPYFWIQTGVAGTGFSLWYHDGTP